MRYMQIIEASDIQGARQSYLQLLERRGIALMPSMSIYVETVHRPQQQAGAWLCYLAHAVQHAA